MAESFRQYIKIRTFLGYRPKEIHLELQDAFGDEAPTYASVQRWSKRFRDAIESPLASQSNLETHSSTDFEHRAETPLNSNAKQSSTAVNSVKTTKSRRSRATRSKTDKSRTIITE